MTGPVFDWDRFRLAIAVTITNRDVTDRSVANQLGIAPSTITRSIRHGETTTIETAARLADWAGLPLDAFTNRTQTIHHPTADQTRAALTALQAAVDATETLRHLLRHTPTD